MMTVPEGALGFLPTFQGHQEDNDILLVNLGPLSLGLSVVAPPAWGDSSQGIPRVKDLRGQKGPGLHPWFLGLSSPVLSFFFFGGRTLGFTAPEF